MISSSKKAVWRTGASLILLAVASPALAAEQEAAAAAENMLEELVVTAQRRAESMQQTPVSMAAFTADDLLAKGLNNVQDLQGDVPNLQFAPHPNSAATPRIFMRGVGISDTQITQDASVAMYLDGVYLARSQGLSLDVADVERIEVLRGPQGTLYGRNATGGAINFITRQPSTAALEFEQYLTLGSRDLVRSRTSVNVPVTDNIAAKASYLRARQDGFVRNRGTGSKYFGSLDREAYMVDLLWKVAHNADVRYTYDHSSIGDSPAHMAPAPGGFESGRRPREGSPFVRDLRDNDVKAQGHSLSLSWALSDAVALKSITSYRKVNEETYQDYLTGAISTRPILATTSDLRQDQFSQEVQASGDLFDDRLKYIAGVYYFEEDADGFDSTDFPNAGRREERWVSIDNKATAVFGQTTWTPPIANDTISFTIGGRWSEDRRKATLRTAAGPVGALVANPQVGRGDNTFGNFSTSYMIEYEPSRTLLVYAKMVEGYKTGGFNVRASSIARFNAGYDEEKLTSYEIGIKSEWLQRRLRVNLAVFQSDYDSILVNTLSDPNNPTVTDALNAGDATIRGVELDVTFRVAEGLTFDASYGYLDAAYNSIIDATGRDVHDDFRFQNAPKHSFNANLQYVSPELSFGQISANVGYSWQDDKFSSNSRHFGQFLGVKAYGLLNGRVALSKIPLLRGDVTAAVWGRNLTNEDYYVDHFNGGVVAATYGEPRTFGIDLTYRY